MLGRLASGLFQNDLRGTMRTKLGNFHHAATLIAFASAPFGRKRNRRAVHRADAVEASDQCRVYSRCHNDFTIAAAVLRAGGAAFSLQHSALASARFAHAVASLIARCGMAVRRITHSAIVMLITQDSTNNRSAP